MLCVWPKNISLLWYQNQWSQNLSQAGQSPKKISTCAMKEWDLFLHFQRKGKPYLGHIMSWIWGVIIEAYMLAKTKRRHKEKMFCQKVTQMVTSKPLSPHPIQQLEAEIVNGGHSTACDVQLVHSSPWWTCFRRHLAVRLSCASNSYACTVIASLEVRNPGPPLGTKQEVLLSLCLVILTLANLFIFVLCIQMTISKEVLACQVNFFLGAV